MKSVLAAGRTRVVSFVLSLVMAMSLCGFAAVAYADDATTFAITESNRTVYGTYDGDNIYVVVADQAYDNVDVSGVVTLSNEAMIAAMGSNYFVPNATTGVAPVSMIGLSYDTFAELIEGEDITVDASVLTTLGIDPEEDNLLGLWIMDANDDMSYYIIKMPAAEAPEVQCDPTPLFTAASSDGSVVYGLVGHEQDGYIYQDYFAGEVKVCLFTVYIPEGTTQVKLTAEKESLFYNYSGSNGTYLAGWVTDYTKGATEVVVDVDSNNDGVLDCIQVQNPYNTDYTGGELRYAVTFSYGAPFTAASADGTVAYDNITVTPAAYAYYDYMAEKTVYVDLYTVDIYTGTTQVALTAEKESLFYNYDDKGNYLAGWVTDYTKGATEIVVDVDSNNDDAIDFIQVQNPYNADYSGGELRYAVTFNYVNPITVSSADGEVVYDNVTVTPASYAYYDYMASETVYADLYTVVIPADATQVKLIAEKESLFYNYDDKGNYLAGWVDDYTKGATEVVVDVDSNNDGVLDFIQVQNPYNADYSGGELRYAVTFVKAATSVEAPVAADGLVYNGKYQTGVAAAEGYTVEGGAATDAGDYTATATLAEGYVWSDGSVEPKQISWSIAKAKQTISVSKVIAATNYNGTLSRLVAPLKSVKAQGELTYSKVSAPSGLSVVASGADAGKVKVAAKTAVGTYSVTIRVKAAATDNYEAATKDVAVTVKVSRFTPTISITGKVVRAVNYSSTKDKTVACPITKIQCASKPMTYELSSAKNAAGTKVTSKFSVDETTGAVTVKAGTAKGTYTVNIKVKSDDNENYRGNYKIVPCTVKVV